MLTPALSTPFAPSLIASIGVQCSPDRALLSAVLDANIAAVQSALAAGENPNAKTILSLRPLHIAAVGYAQASAHSRAQHVWDSICAALIAAGADVLAEDQATTKWGQRFGETAAQRAASIGRVSPSLSRAINTTEMLAKLDGRSGEVDRDGVWRETPKEAPLDGQKVKRARRAGRTWKGKSGILNTHNQLYKSAFQ